MNICGGFAPAFPFPKTKAFDFSKFPRKEPDAEQKLARAADMRAELAQALNVGDPARVAEAADAYLPLAVGIWRALEQGTTKEGRQISFGQSFEWTSSTHRKPEKFFTMYSMRFEVMMVLICRMLAAGNAAASMLEAVQSTAEYEEVAKAALQHVKVAGGLAQFIAEQIQPLKEVLPFERGPEVHKDLLMSINHLYRATGQCIACRQAQNKGMSQALLGKLFAAAAKLLAHANLFIKGDNLKHDFKDLSPPLKSYSEGGSKLLKAVALAYVAEGLWKEKKYGVAVGVMLDAQAHTDQAIAAGILNGASRSLAARLEEHKSNTAKLLAAYQKDNSLVYFEMVKSLEGPPDSQEVTAAHVTPYVLPPAVRFFFSDGPETDAAEEFMRLALSGDSGVSV